MALFLILIIVLVLAVLYWWRARTDTRQVVRQLWHDMRLHRLATALMLLYSILCGIMFVVGFDPPLILAILALPFIAGVFAGWWYGPGDASRNNRNAIRDRGGVVGFLALVLPAFILVFGTAGVAWWTNEMPGALGGWGDLWAEALGWAGGLLGLGIVLGILGAYTGAWAAGKYGRMDSGSPTRPSTRA